MNDKTQNYLKELKRKYAKYGDNDSLMVLAETEKFDDRARELKIYREQEKTQELIKGALQRYKTCLYKLTNDREMNSEERAYCLASMDWCKFTLDIVGESPDATEKTIDDLVENYARKAGII